MANIQSCFELIEDSAFIYQSEVVRRAAKIPLIEREKETDMLRSHLASSEDEHRMIRAAQIAVGWLPEGFEIVLSALESPDSEIRFAIICALMDASKSAIAILQSQLAPAVWRSMITAQDDVVGFIGAELLPQFEPSIIRSLMAETKPKKISAYLVSQLKENGVWFK